MKKPKVKEHLILTQGKEFAKRIEFEENCLKISLDLLGDSEGFSDNSTSEYKCYSKKVDGIILLKIEQEMEINLVNFLSLIYEVEYFSKWFPFVNYNKLVRKFIYKACPTWKGKKSYVHD